MAIIETQNLTKVYGRQIACREICLSVEEGQIFGLLGPNGAGKSTLVKMLVGLVHPTQGKALVAGRHPWDSRGTTGLLLVRGPEYAGRHPWDSRGRREIGFLPENFRLHSWLKGEELLVFHGRLSGLKEKEARHQAYQVLELVGWSTMPLPGPPKTIPAGLAKQDKPSFPFSQHPYQSGNYLGFAASTAGNPWVTLLSILNLD